MPGEWPGIDDVEGEAGGLDRVATFEPDVGAVGRNLLAGIEGGRDPRGRAPRSDMYTGAPVAAASGAIPPRWSQWQWVTRIAATLKSGSATS